MGVDYHSSCDSLHGCYYQKPFSLEKFSFDALGSSWTNAQVDWSLCMSSNGISAMEPSVGTQPSTRSRYSARWTVTGWESDSRWLQELKQNADKWNESCWSRGLWVSLSLLSLRMGWLTSGSMSWPSACSSKAQRWRSCAGPLSFMTRIEMGPSPGKKCWRSCRSAA